MATRIVNACIVLHNICIENNIPEPEAEDVEVDFGMFIEHGGANLNEEVLGRRINPHLVRARKLQRNLINNHFVNVM